MSTLAPFLQHPLWDASRDSRHEIVGSHVRLHYERAKMICQASGQYFVHHTVPYPDKS